MKFKSVEEYYLWASQANCFAPKFKDLTENAKKSWVEDFEMYMSHRDVYEPSRVIADSE